ncbi:Uncharacterized conserved protein YdaU, DUF1376 family [Hymenobacter gelipurpurascens]|uniref:Uncharacterized conserved protein YdaU, DUF1376 family n=1 Tax=Hymenobacter gelipurpurascens TaxID=89968 RepID=A0A212T9B0_9BACT|nr:DUF1376 domain-containing protein [Hymenobacter gelipurpurascens]SNC62384.1 Uncharacterized conserved protein YdaU, DUF1376 family [Hymenobacter gelipurpurascens]
MKSPAFQLYTGDFLSSPDVQMMDAREVGAYCLLLFNAWQGEQPGHLPNSEDKMRRLARLSVEEWQQSREMILSKFPQAPDGLTRYNPRLVAEAEKQWVNRQKQSANGSKGGRPRKNPNESQINPPLSVENPRLSNEKPTHNPEKALHFSSSISTSIKETPPTPVVGVLEVESSKIEGPRLTEELPVEGSLASASHTGAAAPAGELKPEFRPDPEWAGQVRLLSDQMAEYFKLSIAQADGRMRLTRFCRVQFEAGQGPLLQAQFQAYRGYKAHTQERVHSWKGFIGDESKAFADGGWNEKDWVVALADALKTQSNGIQRTPGTGRPAAAGRVANLPAAAYGRQKVA